MKDLKTKLYNAIINWYDDSMEHYKGIDDDDFIQKVCENLQITKDQYMELMFSEQKVPETPVAVTVHYSFDADTAVILFETYEDASKYIKEDFEKEKKIDIEENGYTINEEQTYCNENMAVLATNYRDGLGTTTWTIANVVEDKR